MNRRELAKTLQAQLLYDGDPSDPGFSSFGFGDEKLQQISGLIRQTFGAGEGVAIAGFGQSRVSAPVKVVLPGRSPSTRPVLSRWPLPPRVSAG